MFLSKDGITYKRTRSSQWIMSGLCHVKCRVQE
nr:MAG TPA: hypothetical protein [Caudoviricetes sp.]